MRTPSDIRDITWEAVPTRAARSAIEGAYQGIVDDFHRALRATGAYDQAVARALAGEPREGVRAYLAGYLAAYLGSPVNRIASVQSAFRGAYRAGFQQGGRDQLSAWGYRGDRFELRDPYVLATIDVRSDRMGVLASSTLDVLLLDQATDSATRGDAVPTFGIAALAAVNALIVPYRGYNEGRAETAVRSVPDGGVMKTWAVLGIVNKPREHHAQIEGMTIMLHDLFPVAGGVRWPHDWDMAGSSEWANCVPGDTLVHAGEGETLHCFRRMYEGPLARIETATGNVLTVTPNHPVLTPTGWVPAGHLRVGDDVVSRARGHVDRVRPDEHDAPSRIEEVYGSFARRTPIQRVGRLRVDFHGERPQGDVDVVPADRQLRRDREAALDQEGRQFPLAAADARSMPHEAPRALLRGLGGSAGAAHSVMSGAGAGRSGGGSGLLGPGAVPFAHRAHARSGRPEGSGDEHALVGVARAGREIDAVGDVADRFPRHIAADEVVRVDSVLERLHVYNLHTTTGWYVASGIIVHNCRHFAEYTAPETKGVEPWWGTDVDTPI